jgi:MoCo/4Fe-4S cofactor protein with predicted Tat translocation signal
MSCDESKEARSAAKAAANAEQAPKIRSLPIFQEASTSPPAPAAAGDAPPATPLGPRRYWRSLEEKRGSLALAQAAQREFPPGASELTDSVSRRSFMQLLGSSAALAGIGAACAKPNEKIIPFVRRPEEMTPGNAQHFATSYALEGFASGLLVESHEGRPTKIEGNPEHPSSQGASTALEQALVLSLYDDDRAHQITRTGAPVAWRTLLGELSLRAAQLAKDGGAGLRFLVEPTASPLLGDLRRRIQERFPKAKFVSYSSVAGDGAGEGARLSFGRPLQARHDVSRAAVILSLDADFLGEGPEQLRLARGFSAGREPGAGMNRLYVVEPAPTVTGSMADHRLRLRGSEVAAFAQALAGELSRRPGLESLASLGALAKPAAGAAGWDARWLTALAGDLVRNRGRSLVMAGRRQPAAVHALVNAINVSLGNLGATVTFAAPLLPDGASGPAALGGLAGDIAAGLVDTLVITARNPVYTAPADFSLGKLLRRVPSTIYHTLYEDETAAACNTLVPAAHPLESWCDGQGVDGTVSIVQPLIAPLWGGLCETEVLAAFLDEGDRGAHEILRRYWQGRSAPLGSGLDFFDHAWEKWLADGVVPDTAAQPESGLAIDGAALAGALAPLLASRPAAAPDQLEIAFALDPKVHDGRFANNAWLQELAHPITKLTWDNAALISPATAGKLGLETGDRVEITYRQRTLDAAVMIEPGHADQAITLPLGYGRAGGEKIAKGVGFNAGSIRNSDAAWFDGGATLTKIGGGYKFAVTQDHWTMSPDGRDTPEPALETTLGELRKSGSEFNQDIEERRGLATTIYQPVDYSKEKYKWAMAIDLNKCTGCNACVVACQSENNIPVVGKENVAKGREMQWIRIDRYFSGSMEDPAIIPQPVACVHCETAPCEYVCPTNATVHSDEGLNEMVYNRCIGTRYCSNNCPYKVRRFNFLDYTSETPGARQLGMNPEVTVRSRGIMEKCTYCVQRIERKRIETRLEGRNIQDGELQTACQQGCPSDAIVFGSLNDPGSRVSRLHGDARRYDLLHELGTRPRTAYLARVKNPNPELARVE